MFMTAGEIARLFIALDTALVEVGLLTGLFKLIVTFYMFDLDYPPVHSMFMGIMQTFVTEEQVYSGIETEGYKLLAGRERTGTKMYS